MANGDLTLTLSEVDCVATILLNGEVIAQVDNQFIRHDIGVTGKVRDGQNTLRIEFAVARDVARQRYENHPFPIPYAKMNQPYVGHINFIRKTACHGGWDWGIFFDYSITLLPGRETRFTFTARGGAKVEHADIAASLQVRHLRETD